MSEIPKHLMKPNTKSQTEDKQYAQSRNKRKSIYQESAAPLLFTSHQADQSCARNDNLKAGVSAQRKAPRQKFNYKDGSGDSSTTSVLTHLTNFRKDRNIVSDSVSSDTDMSSTEVVEGLSTSSILELYDTTLKADNAKLKRLQMEIKREFTSCFLKLELARVAILCSTSAKLFLKPFPKFFTINNEPCHEELKSLFKSVKSLRTLMTPKHSALLENRMLIDMLYWIFFESKLPTFVEVVFKQILNETLKIDVLRLGLRPPLVTKVRYGQYSNQEIDHRYYLKYLRQSGEEFESRLGYIAVHMQCLYSVLAEGVDTLIQDKKGVAIYTNFIASVASIRDNLYYLNANYSRGNVIFEYFAVLVAEVIVQKENGPNSRHDVSIYRSAINVSDCVYYVKNVKRIKTKYVMFFKMGATKMVKELMSIDKKMESKLVLFSPGDQKARFRQLTPLMVALMLCAVGILCCFVCFVWFMKTWRYF